MRKSSAAAILLLAFVGVANAIEIQVHKDRIEGRVFISTTNSGVPGLSVRLQAPRALNFPVRVTITDGNGQFAFQKLQVGKYLLTIYQGTSLLYRKEIDNRLDQHFVVSLRPVS